MRQIHLRNETILTPPREAQSATAASVQVLAPANGLFLVQFETPPTLDNRIELKSLGVDLIKYVPDLAFIARFRNTPMESVKALPLVRWVGEYRADHKVHPRLNTAIKAQPTEAILAVNLQLHNRVTPAEILQVRRLLVGVDHESKLRQGVFLRGLLPVSRLGVLTQLTAVIWVEPAPVHKLVDELAAKLVGGDDGLTGTRTVVQQLGFSGQGVTICVADTGLDTGNASTMHPDLFGRVTGFAFYGNVTDGSDGYGHGTHCAGIVAGNAATGETDPDTGAFYGLGVAPGSSLFIERIFDADAGAVTPFPSDATLTRDAVRHGAKIGSNSWGNDVQGEYDTDAAQFDELVRDADPSTAGDQAYILEFSAGNAGSGAQTLDSPASGKNVIATGASQNVPGTLASNYGLYADGPDTICDFSSRGPSEDGRIKPDLVTPGSWIASAASSAAPNEAAIAWAAIDPYYVYMGGTSMAGPHASGAAAIFVQFYQTFHTNATPSPALVKAALINSADELDQSNGGPGSIPNFDEGWGRVTLTNIINTNFSTAPRAYQYVDQTTLLTNGQVYTTHGFVAGSSQPLKITLAYTDVPGFAGALPALVNDLNLEVVGPDGTLYRGNQFAAGESIANAPLADTLNNVEGVHLAQPLPGDYLIRVVGKSVIEDARLETGNIDQDFALVISGDLNRSGAGSVLLDRTNYTAPSTINIEVINPARAASSFVSVTVKSTTEPIGELYTLRAAGGFGVFTGAVATVVATAANDGKLQVHNGDTIEADYVDNSSTVRSAIATAQLNAPVLNGVSAAVDLGIMAIQWQSSEPANSVVFYSTNRALQNLSLTNQSLVSSHLLKLNRLQAGKTYYFFVVSTDAAGNTTTNNNSGALFTFVGVTAPTVLLVDDYDSAGEDDAGSTIISDGSYTNALSAAGFSYSFWKVNDRGYPTLQDVQGFPVLMWRTTDDIVNYDGTNNSIPPPQQTMITAYLAGGGSFFISSMGVLSQLGDVAFRRNVLQIAGFAQNPDPPAACANCDEYFGVPVAVNSGLSRITTGMGLVLDYGNYPSFDLGEGFTYGPDFSDTFSPSTNSTILLLESVSGKPCGLSYPKAGVQSAGRVIFLGFPIDTVPNPGTTPNDEVTLLKNCLNFLAPGANGVGVVLLDNTAYTTSDIVNIQVGDLDLIGSGPITVSCSTSSSSTKVTVTLLETAHPGLFQGSIVLTGGTPSTGQLKVKPGDTFSVTYFDASNNRNAVSTAIIDTTAPVISNVAATTQYSDATVTWQTSKPSDSTIQYGESVILDRTVFSPLLATNHSLTISGLTPNRVYQFQVVSRDVAGNTTADDNSGQLYTFQTLKAIQPPWMDDLESGAIGWTVIPDSSGTDLNWELGTPNNGLDNAAFSGANAWGSNLQGMDFSNSGITSTFLYSPVIDLSGMSSVQLTFWANYDFTSGFEAGQFGVSTNSSTPPIDVPTVADFSNQKSFGWTQETIDLTAFAGKTVQLVWYYFGFQFGSPPDGWLIDDVSLTGVAGGGTIIITKNLGQGAFSLSGPVSSSGTAQSTTLSNLPPGKYVVTYDDVAFYQTPFPQTNTLNLNATVSFAGHYNFIDANHNGISDAWEQYYFGSAGTNRLTITDSDHDGMTDYAEFIAGTNPTNSTSNLRFLNATSRTNGVIQFQWSAIPGRLYQLESSSNPAAWQPLSGWLQAQASPMTYTITNSPSRRSMLYRVQVRP